MCNPPFDYLGLNIEQKSYLLLKQLSFVQVVLPS